MEYYGISYILGLSTMFFGMMAVFFWRRGERLHKLVALLTGTIALECVKDFIAVAMGLFIQPYYWNTMTAVDMVAVPMYAFVLTELVRPGYLTVRAMIWSELPFVVLPVMYLIAGSLWIFYVLVGWAAVYGTAYLIWTSVNIPHYNRHLKERFSYTENVNLNWLRIILYTFYVILGLWILDCVLIHADMECLYMVCNLVLWTVISFFLFRHESVIGELSDTVLLPNENLTDPCCDDSLSSRIETLFNKDRIYLNSSLKLSDVARAAGSNRTYVSNYFNRDAASSFYDYVNTYRINHACSLLAGAGMSVQEVAHKSGFSSASAFSRVFLKHKGCTPTVFRETVKSAKAAE